MEEINGDINNGGPPPPSPLTGCYLLIVIGEPHCTQHKDIILQKISKGLLSWNNDKCLVNLEKELDIITEQGLEGEEIKYGERLIQYASENLVTEILIHPLVSTLSQCIRNLLSSFTRHRHIIHAGYTFSNNGSWILQDGTFSITDFIEALQEIEVLRLIKAYENNISMDIHCASEGDWNRLPNSSITKGCNVRINPNDVLTSGSSSINGFINYLTPFLIPTYIESLLQSSDVVGNIRFSRPTLYIFPGGQGDAALFGINGFNMLLDGGFSRKACFWDFVRHLDRLDAILLTRLNNSNVAGINSVLKRKIQNAVYPQIGHFFCNMPEKKTLPSPDGDKDRDLLLINLLEQGQEIIFNLNHLKLTPQTCYRDNEPINLYHKVGHGTLNMYILNPTKDSKEIREFMQKWNNNDFKLFITNKIGKDFFIPLQNLISICALLIWKPANPEDTITRILFPGSCPQNKIFEGLEKLKNLDCIKLPTCTEKTLSSSVSIKPKSVKDTLMNNKLIITTPEKTIIEEKKEKIKVVSDIINEVDLKSEEDKLIKKADLNENDKMLKSKRSEYIEKSKSKVKTGKITGTTLQQKKLKTDKKLLPTASKKITETINGEVKEQKSKTKISPITTPAKSTKDANNRKVIVESKIKAAPISKKENNRMIMSEKKEIKIDRKPISRRPKDISKITSSPSKRISDISKRTKLEKEGTIDSTSTVSTPSTDQDNNLKKDISKMTSEELADLQEEQEAVKEIEQVFRKGEIIDNNDLCDMRKIKDISIDEKLENEEYLIIEKAEIQQFVLDESNNENQKLLKENEESEKEKSEKNINIEIELNESKCENEENLHLTENSVISEEKNELSSGKKNEKDLEEDIHKEIAIESQKDERGSAIESGATTTAPTLPEDEKIPLCEIKTNNTDPIIEEKHIKEDTKEKDIPTILLPVKTFETVKLPTVVGGIRLDRQSHIRDIVKTPDEVADLPVHEEVDFEDFSNVQAEIKQNTDVINKEIIQKRSDEINLKEKDEIIEKLELNIQKLNVIQPIDEIIEKAETEIKEKEIIPEDKPNLTELVISDANKSNIEEFKDKEDEIIQTDKKDIIKIVETVAEVLKSDSTLEEFKDKIHFTTYQPYSNFTSELRETHITTTNLIDQTQSIKNEIIEKIKEIDSTKTFLNEERKVALDIIHIKEEKSSEHVEKTLVTTSTNDDVEKLNINYSELIIHSKSSESSARSSPSNELFSQKQTTTETSDTISTVKTMKCDEIIKKSTQEIENSEKISTIKEKDTHDIDNIQVENIKQDNNKTEESFDRSNLENRKDEVKIIESDINKTENQNTIEDNKIHNEQIIIQKICENQIRDTTEIKSKQIVESIKNELEKSFEDNKGDLVHEKLQDFVDDQNNEDIKTKRKKEEIIDKDEVKFIEKTEIDEKSEIFKDKNNEIIENKAKICESEVSNKDDLTKLIEISKKSIEEKSINDKIEDEHDRIKKQSKEDNNDENKYIQIINEELNESDKFIEKEMDTLIDTNEKSKFDLCHSIEEVGEMVVDVLTADRKNKTPLITDNIELKQDDYIKDLSDSSTSEKSMEKQLHDVCIKKDSLTSISPLKDASKSLSETSSVKSSPDLSNDLHEKETNILLSIEKDKSPELKEIKLSPEEKGNNEQLFVISSTTVKSETIKTIIDPIDIKLNQNDDEVTNTSDIKLKEQKAICDKVQLHEEDITLESDKPTEQLLDEEGKKYIPKETDSSDVSSEKIKPIEDIKDDNEDENLIIDIPKKLSDQDSDIKIEEKKEDITIESEKSIEKLLKEKDEICILKETDSSDVSSEKINASEEVKEVNEVEDLMTDTLKKSSDYIVDQESFIKIEEKKVICSEDELHKKDSTLESEKSNKILDKEYKQCISNETVLKKISSEEIKMTEIIEKDNKVEFTETDIVKTSMDAICDKDIDTKLEEQIFICSEDSKIKNIMTDIIKSTDYIADKEHVIKPEILEDIYDEGKIYEEDTNKTENLIEQPLKEDGTECIQKKTELSEISLEKTKVIKNLKEDNAIENIMTVVPKTLLDQDIIPDYDIKIEEKKEDITIESEKPLEQLLKEEDEKCILKKTDSSDILSEKIKPIEDIKEDNENENIITDFVKKSINAKDDKSIDIKCEEQKVICDKNKLPKEESKKSREQHLEEEDKKSFPIEDDSKVILSEKVKVVEYLKEKNKDENITTDIPKNLHNYIDGQESNIKTEEKKVICDDIKLHKNDIALEEDEKCIQIEIESSDISSEKIKPDENIIVDNKDENLVTDISKKLSNDIIGDESDTKHEEQKVIDSLICSEKSTNQLLDEEGKKCILKETDSSDILSEKIKPVEGIKDDDKNEDLLTKVPKKLSDQDFNIKIEEKKEDIKIESEKSIEKLLKEKDEICILKETDSSAILSENIEPDEDIKDDNEDKHLITDVPKKLSDQDSGVKIEEKKEDITIESEKSIEKLSKEKNEICILKETDSSAILSENIEPDEDIKDDNEDKHLITDVPKKLSDQDSGVKIEEKKEDITIESEKSIEKLLKEKDEICILKETDSSDVSSEKINASEEVKEVNEVEDLMTDTLKKSSDYIVDQESFIKIEEKKVICSEDKCHKKDSTLESEKHEEKLLELVDNKYNESKLIEVSFDQMKIDEDCYDKDELHKLDTSETEELQEQFLEEISDKKCILNQVVTSDISLEQIQIVKGIEEENKNKNIETDILKESINYLADKESNIKVEDKLHKEDSNNSEKLKEQLLEEEEDKKCIPKETKPDGFSSENIKTIEDTNKDNNDDNIMTNISIISIDHIVNKEYEAKCEEQNIIFSEDKSLNESEKLKELLEDDDKKCIPYNIVPSEVSSEKMKIIVIKENNKDKNIETDILKESTDYIADKKSDIKFEDKLHKEDSNKTEKPKEQLLEVEEKKCVPNVIVPSEISSQELTIVEDSKYEESNLSEPAPAYIDKQDHLLCSKNNDMNMSMYGSLIEYKDSSSKDDEEEDKERKINSILPTYLYETTMATFSNNQVIDDQSILIEKEDSSKDVVSIWDKPLNLPSPAPPINDNKGNVTPKKEKKVPSNVIVKNKMNEDKKRAESPSKNKKKQSHVYVDLTYVPHHGNSYYTFIDFFKRVRARYYVFSGIEPNREVYNALLEAKQTWEDKDLEVTIIPTYDTDILGYWVADNEELLAKYKIDLSPSASRCTINLQDHETSCSAYRLEF